MSAPVKAKKTPRNRPMTFDETLAMPVAPMAAEPLPMPSGLTNHQMRLGLVAIWVAAAIIGGIGLGRVILAMRAVPASAELPVPVAKAEVRVSGVLTTDIAAGRATTYPALLLVAPSNPSQAIAGVPVSTLSTLALQSANDSAALQPGFNHFGRPQGNIGTAPVR